MSNSEETKRPNASFPTVYVANSKDGPVVLDLENDRLLKLNSTALEMWLMVSRGCTEEEIIQSCAQRFDADTTLIREAFILLLQKIDDAGLKDYALVVRNESNPLTHSDSAATFPWSGQDLATLTSRCKPGPFLILKAWWLIARYHLILSSSSMKGLCTSVQNCRVKTRAMKNRIEVIDRVCGAVDWACVAFPRKNLCLPRAAVTTCMLRQYGIAAWMVIGARSIPFQPHAWVEDETEKVLNDFPAVKKLCSSLVRF